MFPEWAINIVAQIPVVGIFVWFILERDKRQARTEEKRDEQWMAFLKEQRTANNTAIGRIAEEVKKVRRETAKTNALLISHDIRAKDAIKKLTRKRT